jgi:hypothetical protein
VNFNLWQDGTKDHAFLGFLPLFTGNYSDFDAGWYKNVGKTICVTLFINIFTPHASKILIFLLKLLMRFCDRGCNKHLRKEKNLNDINDIDVHTKKIL